MSSVFVFWCLILTFLSILFLHGIFNIQLSSVNGMQADSALSCSSSRRSHVPVACRTPTLPRKSCDLLRERGRMLRWAYLLMKSTTTPVQVRRYLCKAWELNSHTSLWVGVINEVSEKWSSPARTWLSLNDVGFGSQRPLLDLTDTSSSFAFVPCSHPGGSQQPREGVWLGSGPPAGPLPRNISASLEDWQHLHFQSDCPAGLQHLRRVCRYLLPVQVSEEHHSSSIGVIWIICCVFQYHVILSKCL